MCIHCNDEHETVKHFILRCNEYQDIRSASFGKITQLDPDFQHLNENGKLDYILGLKCPQNNFGICCKFISEIYRLRTLENDV